MRAIATAIALAILLAGCLDEASPNRVNLAGQGDKQGTEERTLDCDDDGHIAVGVQGEGEVEVRVTDGGGAAIYTATFSGDQEGEERSLSGAKGTWTLRVTFSGPGFAGFGGDYRGQWGITLSC